MESHYLQYSVKQLNTVETLLSGHPFTVHSTKISCITGMAAFKAGLAQEIFHIYPSVKDKANHKQQKH